MVLQGPLRKPAKLRKYNFSQATGNNGIQADSTHSKSKLSLTLQAYINR